MKIEKQTLLKIFNSKIVELLLFFILAVPGFFLAFRQSLRTFLMFDSSIKFKWTLLLLDSLLVCIGIIMVLVGTKTLKKWKYAFVILTLPFGTMIFGLLASTGVIGNEFIIFFVFIAAISSLGNHIVKKHYDKKQKEQAEKNPENQEKDGNENLPLTPKGE